MVHNPDNKPLSVIVAESRALSACVHTYTLEYKSTKFMSSAGTFIRDKFENDHFNRKLNHWFLNIHPNICVMIKMKLTFKKIELVKKLS